MYGKAEINDLANLAFISASANRKISDRSPAQYFPTLDAAELAAHLVPLEEEFRTAESYPRFLAARRVLLADAMTELLNRFRPKWLDQVTPESSDDLEDCALDFTRFESTWDEPRMLVCARDHDVEWRVLLSAEAVEEAITQAEDGISTDLDAAGQQLAVRAENDSIEMELGPFVVTGSADDWKSALERERADAQPLSQAPVLHETAVWEGPRRRFPVTSSE